MSLHRRVCSRVSVYGHRVHCKRYEQLNFRIIIILKYILSISFEQITAEMEKWKNEMKLIKQNKTAHSAKERETPCIYLWIHYNAIFNAVMDNGYYGMV